MITTAIRREMPASWRLRDVYKRQVEQISLEYILLETDCPYMAPEPHRGTRNDSSNLSYVAARIAEIKGVSVQEVEQTTWENACRVFGVR